MEFALCSKISTPINKWIKQPICRMMASQTRALRKSPRTPTSIQELESERKFVNGRDAKTVFIMGATATGKSKLSVDLATNIEAEIINSDKIQVYKGLDILTNKIKEDERKGIPHHLLGFLDPEADFTVHDFCTHVHETMGEIIEEKGRVPIIVGGSNNYIKKLVENPTFSDNFESLFLWVDVDVNVLYKKVEKRVDDMVEAGLVDEVRAMVEPGLDYSRGVWRAIGVPEMDLFLYAEKRNADEKTRKILLESAIARIKENTCRLVDAQLEKIKRMVDEFGWKVHRIDATCAAENGGSRGQEAWDELVLKPSLDIVHDFLGA